jgi:hypothetical protein
MVVLVDDGSWRRTADQPTVGIVEIVYGSIFSFLRISHTILTSDLSANKEELDLHTYNISWFLCPVFYGRKEARGF